MSLTSSGTTMRARVSAVILASLSVVASFTWLPPYPIWSVIVFDAFVIWALTAQGRAMVVAPDPVRGGSANH